MYNRIDMRQEAEDDDVDGIIWQIATGFISAELHGRKYFGEYEKMSNNEMFLGIFT